MTEAVTIKVRTGETIDGDLVLPPDSRALVIFAHGSGSSRHSPRNRFVAHRLNEAGLATLLLDLLTPDEEAADARTRAYRFDIRLLADRLDDAAAWAECDARLGGLALGLFGSSTGAAAALTAAAHYPDRFGAIVSRGGRPDLAGAGLEAVRAPTLLIVGGADDVVLDLNRQAKATMRCEVALQIVPGATHLFEEPGALETVANAAANWFVERIGSAGDK